MARQRELAVSHNRLGDLSSAAGDHDAALQSYRTSLGIVERLAVSEPTNMQWQRDRAFSHNRLGDLALATGDIASAGSSTQPA